VVIFVVRSLTSRTGSRIAELEEEIRRLREELDQRRDGR
jgi:hypothetical protein